MDLQYREHDCARREKRLAGWLRAYPANGPKAMARLLVVTLLADGLLQARELERLARANAYARLGMTQAEFMQVLAEFCQDMLARAPRSEGHCELAPDTMALMLAEVTDPWRRRELMRLMIEAIRADDRVARGESVAFWQALDAWGMTLSDLVPSLSAAGPAKAQPNTAHRHAGHWRMRRLAARPAAGDSRSIVRE